MTDAVDHQVDHVSHGPSGTQVATYKRVFLALAVFTALEYFYARMFQDHFLALVLGLVALAISKAALVALFFMHLKFEGWWVYLLLVPVGLLATALVLALYPDIGRPPSEIPRISLPIPSRLSARSFSPRVLPPAAIREANILDDKPT